MARLTIVDEAHDGFQAGHMRFVAADALLQVSQSGGGLAPLFAPPRLHGLQLRIKALQLHARSCLSGWTCRALV